MGNAATEFETYQQQIGAGPGSSIASCGNVFCLMMVFNEIGDSSHSHIHTYDHITLLAKGQVNVTVNGQHTTYVAPCLIPIAKNYEHKITALEKNTIAVCIHSLHKRDDPGEILDHSLIPRGVNLHDFSVPLLLKHAIEQGFVKELEKKE